MDLCAAHEHDTHVVEFYETEAFLTETVASFLAPALLRGDAAIVVATGAHRQAFATALSGLGVDLDAATAQGRLVCLEAADVLSRFMTADGPDGTRFAATVGPLLRDATRDGRAVRVYGEMVALLWADGDVSSALALEDLWNDLAATHDFELLCAYPMACFENEAQREAFSRVCRQHSSVIPAESYPTAGDAGERHEAVAELQREVAALRRTVARMHAEQDRLVELAFHDALTGIANRRAFDADLRREWALAARGDVDSFLVIADLDDFKTVNDEQGHATGDRVLRGFARALEEAARDTDLVARIGGDEFAVLLLRCDERAVGAFRDRLYAALSSAPPGLPPVRATLGHTSLSRSRSAADALHRADVAMLARKQAAARR